MFVAVSNAFSHATTVHCVMYVLQAWTMVEETDMRIADEKRRQEEKQTSPAKKSILKKPGDTEEVPADSTTQATEAADASSDVTSKRTGTDSKETFALSTTGKVKKTK